MSPPSRANLALLVLLGAGALATTVLLATLRPESEAPRPGPRLGTGYYMTDASLTGTSESGRVLYRLLTREARQTLDDGTIDLDRVRVRYEPDTDVPWDLRADTGRIPAGGKLIQLAGDVVAVTREDDGQPAVIRTDYLELDPENYVAYTDRKVTIDYGDNRLFATGMRAFLKEDRLELISNVNGKFVP